MMLRIDFAELLKSIRDLERCSIAHRRVNRQVSRRRITTRGARAMTSHLLLL
jgi:hypothetical protein